MSKAKAKGTAAETEVVRLLRKWWPTAERRALSGNKDRGDVAGIHGLVVEVKAAQRPMLAAWQRETLAEFRNDPQAEFCMLVVKRPYKPVTQWDAYLPETVLARLCDPPEGMPKWGRMDLWLAVEMVIRAGLYCPSLQSLPSSA